MMDTRRLFFQHIAQTSSAPLALPVKKARGSLLWDQDGREYIDLIAGISVCNIGHAHPTVTKAIKKQVNRYLHVLVYGECIETPQVKYASLLAEHLPASLNSVYFTNSGTEAVEGAMKLAKRATGRTRIIACHKSYHGSTQGSLSLLGDEYWRNGFRPLLPGVYHYDHGSAELLEAIDGRTACVVLETVQAERGVYAPSAAWMKALRQRCNATGALLVLDEVQAGFGRTGKLWGFEHYGITPDILILGKALGGGMPLGAFIADRQLMRNLSERPVLGHITTFGGHPVSCAAGHAAMKVLLKENLIDEVTGKAQRFKELLAPSGLELRSSGLLMALQFPDEASCKRAIDHCLSNGVLTDWFLFAADCMRIAPPLTIGEEEIRRACVVISDAVGMVK